MSLISINDLTFAYEGAYDNVFQDANISFDSNQRIGLVARNGRGKTTLLNILAGKLNYSGSVHASVSFNYFPYEVIDSERHVIDIIAENAMLDPELDEWRMVRELKLMKMPVDAIYRLYSTLSGGERAKVQLASLFLRGDSFLLIDEPTNHLDMEGRTTLGRYLALKKGFILVSHDRTLLDACTTHTMSINRSGITLESGSFSAWEKNKRNRDRLEVEQNKRLESEISRLNTAMERGTVWADKVESKKIGKGPCDRGYIGAHAAKMMQRAKSTQARIQRMIDDKSALLKDIERAPSLKLGCLEHYADRLIEFREVSLSYGERNVFNKLSLCVNRGERIALRGKNGSGKSSVIKLMLGKPLEHTGNIIRVSQLKTSYVNQDTDWLAGSLFDSAASGDIDLTKFLTILYKLDFSRIQFEKDMRDFSAGQRKKALIARSLCEQAHIYIWDEPLNYIDALSRMQIEELLLTYPSTMVFVEHDCTFVNNIATRVIDI